MDVINLIRETHISKAEGALKYDGRTNPDIRRDCWFNTSVPRFRYWVKGLGFNVFYSIKLKSIT